jgi:signal peptidase I
VNLSLITILILSFISLSKSQSQIIAVTDSMEPNIQIGDNLVTDEGHYWTNSVQRFDIVVFEHPSEGFKAVARVIALSGETITIKKNKIFINDKAVKEPFKTRPCPDEGMDQRLPCANFGPYRVPDNGFFLLADNRGGSEDSRLWEQHAISRKQILGKIIKIVPIGKSKSR